MAVYALVEKNRINLEQMMIDTIETIKKRMKEDIFATLEDGQWKKTFKQNVEDALSQLEKRFEEMNKALSRKMAEIPDNDATEKRIMSILIAYGETIKKIIEEEGSRVCKQAQQQKQRNDLLSALEQEAWTITWGHYDDGTK